VFVDRSSVFRAVIDWRICVRIQTTADPTPASRRSVNHVGIVEGFPDDVPDCPKAIPLKKASAAIVAVSFHIFSTSEFDKIAKLFDFFNGGLQPPRGEGDVENSVTRIVHKLSRDKSDRVALVNNQPREQVPAKNVNVDVPDIPVPLRFRHGFDDERKHVAIEFKPSLRSKRNNHEGHPAVVS